MKKITAYLAVLFLAGCANPYAEFYTDRTGGKFPDDFEALSGVPELISGSDQGKDYELMTEEGYGLVGYSSFNAADVNSKKALAMAKKVNASKVLIYSKYTNTVSGSTPLTLPDTQTSTTNINGNVYSNGGYSSYNGTGTTTTYGTKTTYIPYSVNRYEYFASYWAKIKKFRLGAFVKDLDANTRAQTQSNKGVIVTAVVKRTPAFDSDIFKGDIFKKIGDVEISEGSDFMKAIDKYEGKNTKILIYRNGSLIEKNVAIKSRN